MSARLERNEKRVWAALFFFLTFVLGLMVGGAFLGWKCPIGGLI